MRARTSAERLASWVWVVSSPSGKRSRPLRVGGMEGVHVDPEAARVPAHVVEGEQPPVAIEGGVLHALGHDRRRRLLKARDEGGRRVALQQQHGGDLGVHARGGDGLAIRVADRATSRRRCRCDRPAARPARGRGPRRPRAAQRRRARGPGARRRARTGPWTCSSLASWAISPKLRRSPEICCHSSVSGASARRVDEQRADVVEELIADRAGDRPVAQRARPGRGSSPPRPAAPRPRAGARSSRPGRPDRRGGRCAGHRPRPRAVRRKHELVRGGKDLGVLLAHARELADVEEAPVAAGHRIDIEVLGRVAPGQTSSGWHRRRPCGWAPRRARRPCSASRAAWVRAANASSPPRSDDRRPGSMTS